MKTIYKATIVCILLIGTILGLTIFLDQKTKVKIPTPVSTEIRKIFGYCMDGGTLYKHNFPTIPDVNKCLVCACNSQAGYVTCTKNKELPGCTK